MTQAAGFQVGQTIGNYRIVSLLGQGGMGAVYLAERHDDLNMQVALKVLTRTGDAMAAQRFARERQLLARLKHAHIAQIVDGGETEDQRLWFAMEYVEGQTLDAYLAQNQLSLEDKLRLFLKICSAVSYAHQNFVIHRDLKPGNIMVDQEGEPRLLDFGVAGLLAQDEEAATVTLVGRAFTPQYASPEQMRGEPLGAASDVYALGMIFYEMISGVQAYVLQGQSPQIALALICEKPVTRPSDALTTGNDNDAQQLRNKLRGDLDLIATKALAKLAEDRYGSVESLMQDIENYLSFRPISARQPTLTYRLRKLVSRNRRTVALLSGVIALLLAALGYSLKQQQIAERERLLAQQESARAREQAAIAKEGIEFLNKFLNDQGRNIPVQDRERAYEMLMEAKDEVLERFIDYPEIGLDMYLRILDILGFIGYNSVVFDAVESFPFDFADIKDPQKRNQLIIKLLVKLYGCDCEKFIYEIFELYDFDNVLPHDDAQIANLIYLLIVLEGRVDSDNNPINIDSVKDVLENNQNFVSSRIYFLVYLDLVGSQSDDYSDYILNQLDDLFRYVSDYSVGPGERTSFIKEAYRLFIKHGNIEQSVCVIKYMEESYGIDLKECGSLLCEGIRLNKVLSSVDEFDFNDYQKYIYYSHFKEKVGLSLNYIWQNVFSRYFYFEKCVDCLWHINSYYAFALTEEEVASDLHDGVLILNYALFYLLEGEIDQLEELLSSALNYHGWAPELHADFEVYLAKAYMSQGKVESAIPLLENASRYMRSQPRGYLTTNMPFIRDLNEMLDEVGMPRVEI